MVIYMAGKPPPPWLSGFARRRWAVLNPNPEEITELKAKGLSIVEVNEGVHRDVHGDKVVELPFYYSFNVGLDIPEADVYQI
jgi:hypothetical protein